MRSSKLFAWTGSRALTVTACIPPLGNVTVATNSFMLSSFQVVDNPIKCCFCFNILLPNRQQLLHICIVAVLKHSPIIRLVMQKSDRCIQFKHSLNHVVFGHLVLPVCLPCSNDTVT